MEKPKPSEAPSNIATHGCYILTPDIFEILNNQKTGTGGEYYLPEAIDDLRRKGRTIYACEMEYLKTVIEFALRHPDINGEFRRYLKQLDLG